MPISSNSIIHFTASEEVLQKIVEEGFKVKFCRERISTPDGIFDIGVPMVSFCDIPLSQIKDHIDKYGTYGIGLSKEWAIRKGLNPVLYLDKNASLAKNFRLAMMHQIRSMTVTKWSEMESHVAQLFDIFRYLKNYQDNLDRSGSVIPDYRFYDEREWRYVLSREECTTMFLTPGLLNDPDKKRDANERIAGIRLKFDVSDIVYIILKNDAEIIKFIQWLRSSYSEKLTDAEILKLTSRIITVDRIINDF